ncbi:lytic polysaccharide monooxygenase [Micromonospora okii]|uniref:lytic polysaccharide monooxygenase n=1 Tax=Micromonospora okii TaxID=1182970 RepID=UPI001E3CBF25|nr:lytic polysaccharide monooxygenase [Micromonospora okii]
MSRKIVLPLASAGAVVASLAIAAPVQAHGYVSGPPSRQALCAQGRVSNCGQVKYEPQSVEGPKGLRNCHAGIPMFAELNDDSRNWPATSVGSSVTFTWTNTARHATSNWEYYIGGTRVGLVDGGGRQPAATVSHQVNLGGFSGRQKLLAIWNISDTSNAFYSCVDLQIGGGSGNPGPTTSPTRPSTPAPSTPAPSTPAPSNPPATTPAPSGTWATGQSYKAGDRVTYGGSTYQCTMAHTAIAGWEPPNVPALWTRI